MSLLRVLGARLLLGRASIATVVAERAAARAACRHAEAGALARQALAAYRAA